jgi:hypothetical protein
VVEESRVPGVCLLLYLHGNSKWTLKSLFNLYETVARNKSSRSSIYKLYCGVRSSFVSLPWILPLNWQTGWHSFHKSQNLKTPDVILFVIFEKNAFASLGLGRVLADTTREA